MHFSVMVFGGNVEQQMAPFQETNMGPIDAEYMQKMDVTTEVRDLFCARLTFWQVDGRYLNFQEAHECNALGQFVPIAGAVIVDMSASEARGQGLGFATLDEAAADWGAEREGDQYFITDNFNSHWDWWEIGGRWGSRLKLLPDCQGFTAIPTEFDPEFARTVGRSPPGPWEPPSGRCDQARKCDIDWAGMRAEAEAKASELWLLVRSLTKGQAWLSRKEAEAKFADDAAAARDYYRAQPAIQAIHSGSQTLPPDQRFFGVDDALSGTLKDYVAAAKSGGVAPFAVVFRGAWHEGSSFDEVDENWYEQFGSILDQVSEDALVTVIDCHV